MNEAEECILLTGFDAFGDGQPNSSEWLVKHLDGARIGHVRIVGCVLPTCFDLAAQELRRTAHALRRRSRLPLIVCMGMASDRSGLSLEHVAINWRDAPIADNAGHQPRHQRIAAQGPAAYFCSWGLNNLCTHLQQQGIEAHISYSAGTFVCNEVFYSLMRMLSQQRFWSHTAGGFVHLPALPSRKEDAAQLAQNMRQFLTHALRISTTAG